MDYKKLVYKILRDEHSTRDKSKSLKSAMNVGDREKIEEIEKDYAQKIVEVEEDFFTYTCFLYLTENREKYYINETKASQALYSSLMISIVIMTMLLA